VPGEGLGERLSELPAIDQVENGSELAVDCRRTARADRFEGAVSGGAGGVVFLGGR
jgi:hypothetical protein